MTTRQDLEREREALRGIRWVSGGTPATEAHAALTASIARLDALLSLTDEQCAAIVFEAEWSADYDSVDGKPVDAVAHRTVADLVRRTP